MAPALYTDRLSVRPGESFRVHASAKSRLCRLQVARLGAGREIVLEREIEVGDHPVPPDADTAGCRWPAAAEITVGPDWRSGYYDLLLADGESGEGRHFVCVKPPAGGSGAAALVLSTNTYHAYNHFGGRCAYADVGALMRREADLETAMAGAIGVLSTLRPFPPLLIAAPPDIPRLVNVRPRAFQERPFAVDLAWPRRRELSPYDRSAGFVNKWEHLFVAWAEGQGLTLDYFTDRDLEVEPDGLAPYRALLLVGHSEYWSGPERDAIEAFVDAGGGLAIFSGNTGFWKVRFENEGATFICHKWRGFTDDPAARADPSLATHLWSHPAFGRPEAEITGLSFLFGGYHRLGNCVARGAGAYTVWNEDHWAFEGCDLFWGDQIGPAVPLVGYENDGCRLAIDREGRLRSVPLLGVPAELEIAAAAPCAFGETPDSPYPSLIPPEDLHVIAGEIFGADTPQARARLLRGQAVMASFRRGKGEVFNAGTTEWAHGLAARDPIVERITRNVLGRFGAWN